MPRTRTNPKRGEVWMADLGMAAKVRPMLILNVPFTADDRAVVTGVIRTTSTRGTPYEVTHDNRAMKPGAFDAQGLATLPVARLERKLGVVSPQTLAQVEDAVRQWLAL